MPSRIPVVAVLAAFVVFSPIACTEPTTPVSAPVTQEEALPAVPEFPALDRPGQIYVGPPGLYAFLGTAVSTRFVLYDDGTFAMQMVMPGKSGAYRGRYERNASLVDFAWDGATSTSPWRASGTLNGDELAVKYNALMHAADFEDGVYIRSPRTSS